SKRRLAGHRPALELLGLEFLRYVLQLGLRQLAALDEPASHLREGDAHEPAAALARTAGESDHRGERHQIAGEEVDRRHRVELRARLVAGEELALAGDDAAHALNHRIEAAARRPGPDVTEGAQRNHDDTRPQLRQCLGRETAVAERSRPIAL